MTILSPCILPILPVVLSGSLGGGKKRPWGIIVGFVAGFTIFTLFLTAIVNAFGISANFLRNLSFVVIFIFGLALISSKMQIWSERIFSKLAARASRPHGQGFWGGVVIGLSIGLIWTPCVGPILASVISLALTGQVSGFAFFITLAYSLGTALPMMAIMFGGRGLLARVPALTRNTQIIQKAFGVCMILVAVAIFFNYDRKFQTFVLNIFPNYGAGLTALEDNALVRAMLDRTSSPIRDLQGIAPEIISGGEWFNSDPVTIEALRGQQVVLIDFFTYSCINCIRTIPYLNAWHNAYAKDGLTIIGIHTPEFEFEKNPENVTKALNDLGIRYGVVQDNNYATWRAYNNHYWPAKYLIDINGKIVYSHFGEGSYDITEGRIQDALKERLRALGVDANINTDTVVIESQDVRAGSPEIYFGFSRNEYLKNGKQNQGGVQTFQYPENISTNSLYLFGKWKIAEEYAQSMDADEKIIFQYRSKNVFFVAGSESPVAIQILQDGKPLEQGFGKDVLPNGSVIIKDNRLYHLIGDDSFGEHTLELRIGSGGLKAYTFTFG
ncbi:MAG: hypothetical protein US74_C0021G0017 [Parcubacteria group bacterium GW2011_GWA2_38_13]|nr:MAG: hypothetical protein US74_C0021G0017 [Parcubacteria group bacterium GW2011_GWA2_38_13]